MSYTAIIEKSEEGGYVAQCAEIKNAFAQGETIEESKKNLIEVIGLVLECERDIQMKKMEGKNFISSQVAIYA